MYHRFHSGGDNLSAFASSSLTTVYKTNTSTLYFDLYEEKKISNKIIANYVASREKFL